MTDMQEILDRLTNTGGMSIKGILAAMLFATALGLYVYLIYRISTKDAFYSRSFNTTLPIVTVFTAGLVIAMRASLVVSLGMVGALSIVRFRSALKDPMDLAFVFWSITVGIISGSEMYLLAVLASVIATVVLFGLQLAPVKKAPWMLIINGNGALEEEGIKALLSEHTSRYHLKSRNLRPDSLDMIYEIRTRESEKLIKALEAMDGVETATVMNHDGPVRY